MNKEELEKVLNRELDKERNYYTRLVEVLGAIKRVYKKDGGDFANIKSSFTVDDAIAKKYNVILGWEKSVWDNRGIDYLKITYTKDEEGTRNTLLFNVYECLDERDPKYTEMKESGRLVDGGVGLKDFYNFTPGEIMENIEADRERNEESLNLLNSRADEIKAKAFEALEHLEAIIEIKEELLDSGGGFTSVCYVPFKNALEPQFARLRY